MRLPVPGESGAERTEAGAFEGDLLGLRGDQDCLSRLRQLLGRVRDRQRPLDLPSR